MQLVPRRKASLADLMLVDYRPGESLVPFTPLQQVARHVAKQLGLERVMTARLAFSVEDAAELERKTRAFVTAFAPGEPGRVLLKLWMRESRPRAAVQLQGGEVLYAVEAEQAMVKQRQVATSEDATARPGRSGPLRRAMGMLVGGAQAAPLVLQGTTPHMEVNITE
jgi:hypothetical protein